MEELKKIAKDLRKDIVKSIGAAGSGHPGGSLSAVDILTILYFKEMKISPENLLEKNRDFFVMSKGHGAPALYAVLASKGFFPREELLTLRKFGSRLQGHPDKLKTPGVDVSSGSLGQGLSIANGIALGQKADDFKNHIFVLVGDGELQEGQIWEAAMTSAHYQLNNVILLVDNNGLQIDGSNSDIMNLGNLKDKFASFNWRVLEADGHDFVDLELNLRLAKKEKNQPTVIICKTIKGKGISFMENQVEWHGKSPTSEEVSKALSELSQEEI